MKEVLRYTFCSEGPSDRVVQKHIDWSLEQLTTLPFAGEWADPEVFDNRSRDVATRVSQAIAYYPCDILFVHRDADGQGHLTRKVEVQDGLREAGIAVPNVAIVPVRMTEAWLLADEAAIRAAAGRPKSVEKLGVPPLKGLEAFANPKLALEEALCIASGRSGRRLASFRRDLPMLKYRVAELVESFSPLLALPSFADFYSDLGAALKFIGQRRGAGLSPTS